MILLGIVRLLFFFLVGRSFYKLAKAHEKIALGYAIIGVGSYFLGKFIGALIIDGFGELSGYYTYEYSNLWVLELFAIPCGLMACWGFYELLRSSWQKKEKLNSESTELAEHSIP